MYTFTHHYCKSADRYFNFLNGPRSSCSFSPPHSHETNQSPYPSVCKALERSFIIPRNPILSAWQYEWWLNAAHCFIVHSPPRAPGPAAPIPQLVLPVRPETSRRSRGSGSVFKTRIYFTCYLQTFYIVRSGPYSSSSTGQQERRNSPLPVRNQQQSQTGGGGGAWPVRWERNVGERWKEIIDCI